MRCLPSYSPYASLNLLRVSSRSSSAPRAKRLRAPPGVSLQGGEEHHRLVEIPLARCPRRAPGSPPSSLSPTRAITAVPRPSGPLVSVPRGRPRQRSVLGLAVYEARETNAQKATYRRTLRGIGLEDTWRSDLIRITVTPKFGGTGSIVSRGAELGRILAASFSTNSPLRE